MRKASFSVEKATSFTDSHNTRETPPKYLIGCEQGMENEYIKFYDYDNFRELAETKYVDTNKQKMQQKQKDNMFEEALISLEKHHTKDDVIKLFEALNKKYTGHTLINLAIHRDEGHFLKDGIEYYPAMHILQKDDGWYILDENDTHILEALKNKDFKPKNEDFKIKVDINEFEKVYNYHAHAVFSRFDLELGKSARFDKKTMSERYKFVAEKMQMRYEPTENRLLKKSIGQHKADLSTTRNAKLVIKKELENEHQKELAIANAQIQDLKKENSTLKGQNTKNKKEIEKLKSENQALKIDNEDLKFSKKELENQIKDLNKNLRESLKELGALRPQYAELEQLNKELKEELKNELLNHEKVIKSYQDLEKKLKEEITKKDEKIDTLEVENKDLKNEIEALKYQLDLKEKRSNSYFGLNEELKSEIKSLKEQINTLEEQKEDIEKDTKLEKLIENMEKNTTSKTKLFAKFDEIDNEATSNEAEEPAKNRSVRKNR